jgi:hypothetical protein
MLIALLRGDFQGKESGSTSSTDCMGHQEGFSDHSQLLEEGAAIERHGKAFTRAHPDPGKESTSHAITARVRQLGNISHLIHKRLTKAGNRKNPTIQEFQLGMESQLT